MKIKLYLIVVLFSLTLLHCKKDDKTSPTSILTSKVWHRGFTDLNPATNPPGNAIYHAVKDCERDDTFTFGVDGKLTLDRGDDACDPGEAQVERELYTIDRPAKELVIAGTTYTLAEESSEQIKYYANIPSGTGFESLVFLLQ